MSYTGVSHRKALSGTHSDSFVVFLPLGTIPTEWEKVRIVDYS